MTPEQKRAARAALGLPNPSGRSYRNRFYGGKNDPTWSAMVDAGLALSEPVRGSSRADYTHFWLTRQAAEAALEPGESLDPEDFPLETA